MFCFFSQKDSRSDNRWGEASTSDHVVLIDRCRQQRRVYLYEEVWIIICSIERNLEFLVMVDLFPLAARDKEVSAHEHSALYEMAGYLSSKVYR